MELSGLIALLFVVTMSGETRGVEVPGRPEKSLMEARHDRYYDVFGYWWPWFSDLTTVVIIKLKIWVILVAMLVFGDGYYWSKWNGSSTFENSQWAHKPGVLGWGRRKRRSILSSVVQPTNLADIIFDTLDISDDTCRKRIVCELYLEGKHVPGIWRALNAPGYEVFAAYRPDDAVLRSADCGKHHHCQLVQRKTSPVQLQQSELAMDDATDSDWRWPR